MCTLIGLCRKKGSMESRIREDMKSRTRPGYGWLKKAFFSLYQHNWEDRVAKNFQRQLFSSLCHWLSDTQGMLVSSPAFIPSTFSSERRFLSRAGPWQAPVYSFNELNSLHRARRRRSELLWRNQPTFIKNNSNQIQRRHMKHINIARLWLRTSERTPKWRLPNIPLKIRPEFLNLSYIFLSLYFLCRGDTSDSDLHTRIHLLSFVTGLHGCTLCPAPFAACTAGGLSAVHECFHSFKSVCGWTCDNQSEDDLLPVFLIAVPLMAGAAAGWWLHKV